MSCDRQFLLDALDRQDRAPVTISLCQPLFLEHGDISGAERHEIYYEPRIIGQEVPGDTLPAHIAQ